MRKNHCRNPRAAAAARPTPSTERPESFVIVHAKSEKEKTISTLMQFPAHILMEEMASVGPWARLTVIDCAICILAAESMFEDAQQEEADQDLAVLEDVFEDLTPAERRRMRRYFDGSELANDSEFKGLVLFSLILRADDEDLEWAIERSLRTINTVPPSGGRE